MSKIVVQLKVIEVIEKVTGPENYGRADIISPERVEENSIKIEVDSYEKAEAKVTAFFKMLGL